MNIKLPEHVDLGYKRVRIVAEQGDLHGNLGGFHADRLLIAIAVDKHSSPIEVVHTVLHECLHAVYELACLEPGDEEERVVSIFGAGLTELLKRNPHLLDWLKEQLAGD